MTSGADVQAALVATFVDEWVRGGVTDAVVAPGSRSTPVVDALAADGRIRLHVVLDERSGGFLALGLGLAARRPAIMLTTSGTAAVELHPAVVEAHQAGVALLAVTADRPAELHHVGAPQTVEQAQLYGAALRWAVDVGVGDEATAGSWRSIAARSVTEALVHPSGPGPVHVNLQLREPLLGRAGRMPPGRPGGAPWHEVTVAPGAAGEGSIARLVEAAAHPGLIVAGAGAPPPAVVLGLAEALGWPVLADARSGCRVAHPLVVAAADSLLRTPEVAAWCPATVLRLGRPWASKVLTRWLAGLGASTTQILVDPAGSWVDPERTAAVVVRDDPAALCEAVTDRLRGAPSPSPGWAQQWQAVERVAQEAIDAQLDVEVATTEAAVARDIVRALPEDSTMFVSSSMPVRDVEWWAPGRPRLRVLSNRGANGIDGIVSSALGVALAGGPTVCLTGDLAFLYDAGGLLGAAARPVALTFVVVDNDGGGIFSFLPQATVVAPDRFERFWSTPHGLDLAAVAQAYGIRAWTVAGRSELVAALSSPPEGVRVLVVRTDRSDNVAAHERLNAAVARAVRATVLPVG